MPIIALSSLVSPAAIERGRQAGFHDYVAKFDRPGLIAALKEQTADTSTSGIRQYDEIDQTSKTDQREGTIAEYVTAMIGGQLFGLPISRVQDVFMPERLTRVPLSSRRDRRRAQPARPHRHRDRHARPARAAEKARRRQAADGGRASTCAANPTAC